MGREDDAFTSLRCYVVYDIYTIEHLLTMPCKISHLSVLSKKFIFFILFILTSETAVSEMVVSLLQI